jgi:hypothetical protein
MATPCHTLMIPRPDFRLAGLKKRETLKELFAFFIFSKDFYTLEFFRVSLYKLLIYF